jgi:lipoprotein-anchoring transpeptidase ErfK/SrfK
VIKLKLNNASDQEAPGVTRPRAVLLPAVSLVMLFILALSVRPGLAGLAASVYANRTPTPTKTPRPETRVPGLIPIQLTIVPFTATPAATVTPAAATPAAPPGELAEVARQYGIDPARRFIVIDPDHQLMSVWDPAQGVRRMPVSTGDTNSGYRTPAWYGLVGDYWGTFQAFGTYADNGWYLYEDAGSILIHGAPYVLQNGKKVYEDLDALGHYPASRGCIRLRPDDAVWFTAWQPKGVPLVILPHQKAAG